VSVAAPAAGASQPALGRAGLWLVVPVAIALSVGAGGPEPSVLVLAPIVTFGLPLVAMVAFWWNGWPGSRLRPGWSGLLDTALIVVGAVGLTVLGQAVVAGHVSLDGVFDPTPAAETDATFPATMRLAGVAFIAILQITLVSEGWPLRFLGPYAGGIAAVVVSWGAALFLDRLEINGALLVLAGAWQVWFFVAWGGRPVSALRHRWLRLAAGNALVIGGAWVSFVLAHDLAGVGEDALNAAAGSLIAAALIVGMLFEYEGGLVSIPLLAVALYVALEAIASAVDWQKVTPDEWVTHVTLNAIGVSVILHVAIGQRWPFGSGAATRS
jgi:hypothetical protein